jgi:hypothetical protein
MLMKPMRSRWPIKQTGVLIWLVLIWAVALGCATGPQPAVTSGSTTRGTPSVVIPPRPREKPERECPNLIVERCKHPPRFVSSSYLELRSLDCAAHIQTLRRFSIKGRPFALAPGLVSFYRGKGRLRLLDFKDAYPRLYDSQLMPRPRKDASLTLVSTPKALVAISLRGCKAHCRVDLWWLDLKSGLKKRHVRARADRLARRAVEETVKARVAGLVKAHRQRQYRLRCMRSSAGCHYRRSSFVGASSGRAGRSDGWIPFGKAVRAKLVQSKSQTALLLIRKHVVRALERRKQRVVLLRHQAKQPFIPLQLYSPQTFEGGYLALLGPEANQHDWGYPLLVRFDKNARPIGGPLSIGAFHERPWLGACNKSRCLVGTVTSDGNFKGRVVQLLSVSYDARFCPTAASNAK